MEKKLPRNRTSSPRSSGETMSILSPSGLQNDSFLEDLDLIPQTPNAAVPSYVTDRNVTTRQGASPSLIPTFAEMDEFDTLIQQRTKTLPAMKVTSASIPKEKDAHKPKSRESKSMDSGIATAKESKMKLQENKMKTQEYKMKLPEELKNRIQENKCNVKDRTRRSEGSKENSRCLDASSKENSRPLDSSKENSRQLEITKERCRHSDIKKLDAKEILEPVALLNAIKELITTYTKHESAKILRTLQDLHINSQANLMKSLIFQTDDLKRELHPGGDSTHIKILMEENEKLREGFSLLKMKNEELQKIVNDIERIKEENVVLKQKCKEMLSQKLD